VESFRGTAASNVDELQIPSPEEFPLGHCPFSVGEQPGASLDGGGVALVPDPVRQSGPGTIQVDRAIQFVASRRLRGARPHAECP